MRAWRTAANSKRREECLRGLYNPSMWREDGFD